MAIPWSLAHGIIGHDEPAVTDADVRNGNFSEAPTRLSPAPRVEVSREQYRQNRDGGSLFRTTALATNQAGSA